MAEVAFQRCGEKNGFSRKGPEGTGYRVGKGGFPGAQMVKNSPAEQETQVQSLGGKIWRRKWPPTPVFLLREFHGQWSPAGCRQWDHKELDTTERLTL